MHYRSSNPIMTDILKVLSECEMMVREKLVDNHNFYPKVKGSHHNRQAALREVSALVRIACKPSLENNSVFQTLVRLGCSRRHSFTLHHNQFELKPDDRQIQEDVHKLFEKYAVIYDTQQEMFPLVETAPSPDIPKSDVDQIKDIIQEASLSTEDTMALIHYLSDTAPQRPSPPPPVVVPTEIPCDCGPCQKLNEM